MVLGYADVELLGKIASQKIEKYRILRYRDDYRIFVNNSQDGERILKCLTEVLLGLGLALHPTKTDVSGDVITSSIKEDKLKWMTRKHGGESLQKRLLIIHDHGTEYPNSGSLVVALDNYLKHLAGFTECDEPLPLISIVVDIAFHNPKTYVKCAAILSKFLSFIESDKEKRAVTEKIKHRFSLIPNTGQMQIWLQRISLQLQPNIEFDESLCQLVSGENVQIWNSDWISSIDLMHALDAGQVIDQKKLQSLDGIIPVEEVKFTSIY